MKSGILIASLFVAAGLIALRAGGVIRGDDPLETTLRPSESTVVGEPPVDFSRVARSSQSVPEPESVDGISVQAPGFREITGHLHFVDKLGSVVNIEKGELKISVVSPSIRDGEVSGGREFRVPFEGSLFTFQLEADEVVDEIGPAFDGPFAISGIEYCPDEISSLSPEINVTLKTSDMVTMRVVDAETGTDLPLVRFYAGSLILSEVSTGRYTDATGYHVGSEPVLVTSSPLQLRPSGLSFVAADAPGYASVEFETDSNEAPSVLRLPREGRLDVIIDADWEAVATAGDLVLRVGRPDHAEILVPLEGRAQGHIQIEGLPPGEITVAIETERRGEQEGYELSYLYPWPVISSGETTSVRLDLHAEILDKPKKDVVLKVNFPPALALDLKTISGTLATAARNDDVMRNLRFDSRGDAHVFFAEAIGTWPGRYILSLLGEEIELEVSENSAEIIDVSFPDRPPLELILRDPDGRLLVDADVLVKQKVLRRCEFSPTHKAHLIPFSGLALEIRRRNVINRELGPVIDVYAWRFAGLRRFELVVPRAHRLDVWFKVGSGSAFTKPELNKCIRVLKSDGHPVPSGWKCESRANRWWLEEEGRYLVEFLGNAEEPAQRKVIEVRPNESLEVRFDLRK